MGVWRGRCVDGRVGDEERGYEEVEEVDEAAQQGGKRGCVRLRTAEVFCRGVKHWRTIAAVLHWLLQTL